MNWSYGIKCRMFGTMAPDNGIFTDSVMRLICSSHLIGIDYHRPVGNYLDTINWLTGGGYDSSAGWNLGGNATSWWGIFLFNIENWHPTNYVGYGSQTNHYYCNE